MKPADGGEMVDDFVGWCRLNSSRMKELSVNFHRMNGASVV